MRIGVDIMGGDFWPQAPVEGAIHARKTLPEEIGIVLIGDEEVIRAELKKQEASPEAFGIVHTPDYIGMSESPTKALVQKPQSTINVGVGLMKEKQIDGFVSAGNTGAMLVASIMGLGKIGGVNRPTIGVRFNNAMGSPSLLCDVGANLDCKAETLYHFGVLGSIFMKCVHKLDNPRVALVNVGEEENKGPAVVQAAHSLMKNSSLINFIGNVEGRDIYTGAADVYVCDGYTGNIVLKFGESFYDIFKSFSSGGKFMETFNFENYGGVPILGIKGISIIGHGISTARAISKMIESAAKVAQAGLVEQIESAFQSIHATS